MTSHRLTLGLLTAAIGGLALVPSPALAKSCGLTADEKYHRANNAKPTYTRSLKVSGGATCATGHKMIGAYYRCRVAAPSPGKKGRCTAKTVLRYSCKETRSNVIPTQFDAHVVCTKGRAKIITDYTQFT
jgi:hypothetical protein